jgi:hypothetical protein
MSIPHSRSVEGVINVERAEDQYRAVGLDCGHPGGGDILGGCTTCESRRSCADVARRGIGVSLDGRYLITASKNTSDFAIFNTPRPYSVKRLTSETIRRNTVNSIQPAAGGFAICEPGSSVAPSAGGSAGWRRGWSARWQFEYPEGGARRRTDNLGRQAGAATERATASCHQCHILLAQNAVGHWRRVAGRIELRLP